MIRFQRTMRVRQGVGARLWAKELLDYLNTTHKRPAVHLFSSRFGNMSTLYWVADFNDLAALQAWQERVEADTGYRDFVKRSADIVLHGTVEDNILQSVSA